MKILSALVLYTALALGANPAMADVATAEALREGDMKKLVFHSAPKPFSQAEFDAADGNTITMADYGGKVVVLNFWATWCVPCRVEMPMLSELQSELGGDDFEVVTIATLRNALPAMQGFFDEIGVNNLPLHRDPQSVLAREAGVPALPTTLILNRKGEEIARLFGEAHWNSDNAKAIIKTLIEDDGTG